MFSAFRFNRFPALQRNCGCVLQWHQLHNDVEFEANYQRIVNWNNDAAVVTTTSDMNTTGFVFVLFSRPGR